MSIKTIVKGILLFIDYCIILKGLTLLPYKYGRAGARIRGILYYHLRWDWRKFTFGDTQLHERSYRSYQEILKGAQTTTLLRMVRERYIHQSIEEYDATALFSGKFPTKNVRYEGLEAVLEHLQSHPHPIFITAHFGSSLVGVHFLHVLGIPILGMSSNVTQHPNVHPCITKLYEKKYRTIAAYLNGGDVIDKEGNTRRFLKFLKMKGSLVIISDLPPSTANEEPYFVEFFGQRRGFASGAKKMAESNSGTIIGFVTYYDQGEHVVKFSLDQDPYRFLEEEIQIRPGLWWANDLLGLYPIEGGHDR